MGRAKIRVRIYGLSCACSGGFGENFGEVRRDEICTFLREKSRSRIRNILAAVFEVFDDDDGKSYVIVSVIVNFTASLKNDENF